MPGHDTRPFLRPFLRPVPALLAAGALLAPASGAWAQPAARGGADAAAAAYQRELADCRSGKSQQDTATCLREARNAHAEARRGRLDGAAPDPENALRRCESLPADQRADCRARMTQGTTSGSVESGGILREYRQVVPAPAASAPR